MDNVTHTLIGYALGRAVVERPASPARGAPASPRSKAVVWASVVASNVPDVDLVVSLVADDPKLAYLLHHRGHSHTLLLALPAGLAVGMLLARWFRIGAGAERRKVAWVGALAALLHLGFDALNNYGVHPFFPVDNHWYYGDSVFIVEPWLLAALLPLPALRGWTRIGRWAARIGCAAMVAACWTVPMVSVVAASFATTLIAIVAWATWRGKWGARGAFASALACVGIFAFASGLAARSARAVLQERAGDERLAQLVMTPAPGNPLCWSALSVTTQEGVYTARFGEVSVVPWWIPPRDCRFMPWGRTTAPLDTARLEAEDEPARFRLQFRAPLEELQRLARNHCDARAALRFVRAAYWTSRPVIGDLRYDTSAELDFADVPLDGTCPDAVPPWEPPLGKLLSEPTRP